LKKRVTFNNPILPFVLIMPQMLILIFMFFWPAGQAVYQSLTLTDPFGTISIFVGLENFRVLFADPEYWSSVRLTMVFTITTVTLSLGASFVMAIFADRIIRGSSSFKTLLIWPYAVAPAVAGILWVLIFHPIFGAFALFMKSIDIPWDPFLNGTHAMILVVVASAWKIFSFNFIFFLAGLQAIPKSLIEASAIDGAGPIMRIRKIVIPLLSPTLFFLAIMNIVYAFFETFGIIHAVTQGGPGNSTTILVYKVYRDGFIGQDLGSSSAQSVLLMILVISLTIFQFRYIEKKVNYA